MIPREFLGFMGIAVLAVAIVVLAVAEREKFRCDRSSGGVSIGGVIRLYNC